MQNQRSLITIDITHSPYVVEEETTGVRRLTTYTASYGRLLATTRIRNAIPSSSVTASSAGQGAIAVLSTQTEPHASSSRATATRVRSARNSTTRATTMSRVSTTRPSTTQASVPRSSIGRVSTTSTTSTTGVPTAHSSTARASAAQARASAALARASALQLRAFASLPSVTQSRGSSTRSRASATVTAATSEPSPSPDTERRILRGVRRVRASNIDEMDQTLVPKMKNSKKNKASKTAARESFSYIFGRIFCPVCFCDLLKAESKIQSTQCGHVFCKTCIKEVLKNDGNCPTCRGRVTNCHAIYLPMYDD